MNLFNQLHEVIDSTDEDSNKKWNSFLTLKNRNIFYLK